MSGSPESDGGIRRQVLKVAMAELATKSVGSFTLEGVAAKAGVDPMEVRQIWPNTPELYTAAMVAFATEYITIPDTGTLRGDLIQYARSYAKAMNSPLGRRLIDAVTVSAKDWDVAGSRSTFLDGRHNRVTVMIDRAIERGEYNSSVDPGRFIDMLGGCLSMSQLYYDRDITDEDCEAVVDMLLYGVTPRA